MNLEDMKGAVILLGLIALIGSAVGIALTDFKSEIADNIVNTNRTNNESVTASNGSAVQLSRSTGIQVTCNTVFNASNHSTAEMTFPATCYTCNSNGITIDDGTVACDLNDGTQVNVSYTFGLAEAAYNITISGEVGVVNATDYLDTIGTIIGVAVLIGIVVLAFTFTRR